MHAASILAIIFGSIIMILAIICGTIITAIKLRGSVSKKNQKHNAEEAETIQQLYQGLSRMEERTEALETLLLDKERKEGRR
jgi:phage shock protein B